MKMYLHQIDANPPSGVVAHQNAETLTLSKDKKLSYDRTTRPTGDLNLLDNKVLLSKEVKSLVPLFYSVFQRTAIARIASCIS